MDLYDEAIEFDLEARTEMWYMHSLTTVSIRNIFASKESDLTHVEDLVPADIRSRLTAGSESESVSNVETKAFSESVEDAILRKCCGNDTIILGRTKKVYSGVDSSNNEIGEDEIKRILRIADSNKFSIPN